MRAKEIIKIIVVSIVILGLLATYGLSAFVTDQGQGTSSTSFNGPAGEPYTTGPTSQPYVAGPSAPPPTNE